MDAVSYSHADKQKQRIEKFIENPDSTSGIVTVPKTIASGETVTVPTGRVAVLPNVQVDGTLNVEGEVFIPSGATFGDLENQIALKADTSYVNNKYSGFKNYLINGNFDIWQRGTSFSSISSSFFTADRWWLDYSSVATGLSASKQPGLVGKNSLYILRTGGAKMQVYQMVENQGNLSNKIFTFSALVRSTYNGTVYFRIGDGRNGVNFVYEQTPVTLNGDNKLKKLVFTIQLGQVSANALFVALATTCTDLFIERVQMEEGSVATPFEQRPIGLELSLCERYFKGIREYIGCGTYNGVVTVSSIFGTVMRVTPTLSNSIANPGFGTVGATYQSIFGLTFTGAGNGQGQLAMSTALDAEL